MIELVQDIYTKVQFQKDLKNISQVIARTSLIKRQTPPASGPRGKKTMSIRRLRCKTNTALLKRGITFQKKFDYTGQVYVYTHAYDWETEVDYLFEFINKISNISISFIFSTLYTCMPFIIVRNVL